jgi:hypothetical protein
VEAYTRAYEDFIAFCKRLRCFFGHRSVYKVVVLSERPNRRQVKSPRIVAFYCDTCNREFRTLRRKDVPGDFSVVYRGIR